MGVSPGAPLPTPTRPATTRASTAKNTKPTHAAPPPPQTLQTRHHHIRHPDHHPCCSTAFPIAVRTRIQIRRCLAHHGLPEKTTSRKKNKKKKEKRNEDS